MTRSALSLFFLVLILMSGNASAGWLEDLVPPPFDILYETVFDDDWGVSDKHGAAIKRTQTTDNSWAWIDIVGFKNESIINETRYVNGTPRSFAIVKYDSGYSMPNNHVFVSYDVELGVIDNEWDHGNDTTEAIMNTKFVHKYWFCEPPACLLCPPICYWIFVTECLTISSIVDSPETFNNSIDDYEITITSYNNSVTPYTLIHIPDRWNVYKTSVEYGNNTTLWYNLTGLVRENDRGTEHVWYINETTLLVENNTVRKLGKYYVVNEAPLNWSQLNISVFTPYVVHDNLTWNATTMNSEPSDYIYYKVMFAFLAILGVFVMTSYILLRRFR